MLSPPVSAVRSSPDDPPPRTAAVLVSPVTGGVRQPRSKEKATKKISELQAALDAKEEIIERMNCEYEAMMEDMQAKFNTIYDHCKNLAQDRQKKMDYITILLSSEEKAKEISTQQQNLTKSLLALVEKQRKTKFIDGNQSIYCEQTEPRPVVRQEMAVARNRIQEQDVASLAIIVDELAAQYGPDRSGPGKMFSWVHSEMLAMWVYTVEEEVTPEEEELFDKFLQKQLRPDPISSPHLPKASVNWNRLNPGQFRNLPTASELSVSGCSHDPNFYSVTEPRRKEFTYRQVPKWESMEYPFGKLFGFITNMGVVSVPDQSVHGYRCCEKTGVWMIVARG